MNVKLRMPRDLPRMETHASPNGGRIILVDGKQPTGTVTVEWDPVEIAWPNQEIGVTNRTHDQCL